MSALLWDPMVTVCYVTSVSLLAAQQKDSPVLCLLNIAVCLWHNVWQHFALFIITNSSINHQLIWSSNCVIVVCVCWYRWSWCRWTRGKHLLSGRRTAHCNASRVSPIIHYYIIILTCGLVAALMCVTLRQSMSHHLNYMLATHYLLDICGLKKGFNDFHKNLIHYLFEQHLSKNKA